MALRVRNTLSLVKLEPTEGVDSTPGTADFITLTGLTNQLNPDLIADNELRGGLGSGEPVIGAFRPVVTLTANLRGSGVAATPQASFSAVFKAAGLVETLTAAAIPSTGTTTAASGTSTTVTFDGTVGNGTQWPSTAGTASGIIGHPIELAGNPSTATVDIIRDYQVSGANRTITLSRTYSPALSASTTLKRLPHGLWKPGSPDPHPSVTIYNYYDGIRERYTGCRPNLRFLLRGGNKGTFEAAFSGQLVDRGDFAVPAIATVEQSPPIWVNGVLTVDNVAAAISEMNLDLGNQGQFPTNPNQISGLDPYVIGSRTVTGSLNPLLTLTATRNLFQKVTSQTKVAMAAILGNRDGAQTAGTRFGILIPSAKLTDNVITEDGVVRRESAPFQAVGFQDEFYLTHF